MFFAFWISTAIPSFVYTITDIIDLRTQKKMTRVYAELSVAMMQHI
jgi:hypothetical protein